MADLRRRRAANAPGEFFVDDTCIDCDACRAIAPRTFVEDGGQSAVTAQPESDADRLRAAMALVACPTHSIGARDPGLASRARAAFPEPVADGVFYCGWHHRDSFGAASWLIVRPPGNVLVDSPRFVPPLVRALEAHGGVRWMFLTHRDDVADHAAFRRHFGCTRVLHAADVDDDTRDVERPIAGTAPVRLDDDLLVVPTPGHTRGSACLRYRDRFLFTGDHLAWSERRRRLTAFRDACWYDWRVQTDSMTRLLAHRFEWVLPGHGRRCHLAADVMQREIERCVEWMKAT